MDGVNQHTIATIARLRAAGLYDIVERTAKKLDLLPKHVLPLGEVTNGHRAAWQAVRAKGRSVADVARLFGFPVEIVAPALSEKVPADDDDGDEDDAPPMELAPKAKAVKPAPKSAPRLKASPALPEIPDLEAPEPPSRKTLWEPLSELAKCLRDIERAGVMPHVCAAAERHGVTVTAVVSKRRPLSVVLARREAVWRLSTFAGLSSTRIGVLLGGRDHTTILDYLKKFTPGPELLALVPKPEAA
jgi:hypothetical protein